MHRQQQQQQQLQFQGPGSSSNFQSIRKMRQISRKLQPAAEGEGYAYPELVSTNHTGVGPGAQARAAADTAPLAPPHRTLQSATPGAPLSTPERLHEESANFRAYLLLSPDDKPPVLDILANLDRTPAAASNFSEGAHSRLGAHFSVADGALHGGRNNRRSLSNRRPVRDATVTTAPVPAPLATPMNSDYANVGHSAQLTGIAPADGPYHAGPPAGSAAPARKGKRAAI